MAEPIPVTVEVVRPGEPDLVGMLVNMFLAGYSNNRTLEAYRTDLKVWRAWRAVHKICRVAGLNKRISPHSLRHAAITACLDAGVPIRDVADFARHVDLGTTSKYDRNRQSLDRNPTYTLAAFVGG